MNWRNEPDSPDPDDELLPATPRDVVEVLGFDPALEPEDVAIQASDPEYAVHNHARDLAALDYHRAVGRYISAAEADAMRKRKGDELLLYWLMLMEDEEAATYMQVARRLNAPVDESAARAFAESRQAVLTGFPTRIRDRLKSEAEAARAEGLNNRAVLARVRRLGEHLARVEGSRLAQAEAQATYGYAQLNALVAAGYKTKVWVTMEDERVRPTHNECGEQGEVPIDQPFANGLQYPGDPTGGPEEVVNCRCWLVGGTRE